MAAIGDAWADGAWNYSSWAVGAWLVSSAVPAATPQTGSSKKGKRPRYVVEVDGELIQVASIADAEAVLLQVRELAEQSAQNDVKSPVTPKPPRISVKTVLGKQVTSKALSESVKKTQRVVSSAYIKAAKEFKQNQEISQLLIAKIEEDEEDSLITLLL